MSLVRFTAGFAFWTSLVGLWMSRAGRGIALAIALLGLATSASAQVCVGDFRLESQEDVNAFACVEVTGSLFVKGPDITSLSGLSRLTTVDALHILSNPALRSLEGLGSLTSVERLYFSGTSLESLDGLDNLTSIGERLSIVSNAALTSLSGLDRLTSVDNLTIGENAVLTSLTGLSSLTSVDRFLYILNNPSLESLNGLGGLTSVEVINIPNNASLASLDGLDGLASVVGLYIRSNSSLASLEALSGLSTANEVWIEANPTLVSLDGLGSFASLGRLIINQNASLTSLSWLSGLVSVDTDMYVVENASLASLDGLGSLASVGFELNISGNPALTTLEGLGSLSTVGRDVFIQNNATLASLDGLGSLTSVGQDLVVQSNAALSMCSCGLSGLISEGAFTGIEGAVVISENAPVGTCTSPEVVLATPCERPVACADGAALIFDQTTFDSDGEGNPNGEVIGLQNLSESAIDLATCSFAAFDPFTERVTFSTGLEGTVAGIDGDTVYDVLIRSVGEGSLLPEGSIPDGPGALVVVEGEVPVGASVADVLPVLISGIVYRTEDEIVGIYSDAPSVSTNTDDFLAALASLANSVAGENGGSEINLTVVAAPNPLRDLSAVTFGVTEAANVRISVFDALGREVSHLAEGLHNIGRHEVVFDARDLPAGMYVIHATIGDTSQTVRVMLAR